MLCRDPTPTCMGNFAWLRTTPPSPSPSHTHISSALPSLGLCLDVRGYYSRRFHVQSCGHVFQVLIKLPRKIIDFEVPQAAAKRW